MDRSPERRAANVSTFRDANERIEDRAQELDLTVPPIPFICECEDERCTTIVRLTFSEYERVRSESRQFLVAPGHGSPPDRVIAEREHFTLLEKTGAEGSLVDRADPRS